MKETFQELEQEAYGVLDQFIMNGGDLGELAKNLEWLFEDWYGYIDKSVYPKEEVAQLAYVVHKISWFFEVGSLSYEIYRRQMKEEAS